MDSLNVKKEILEKIKEFNKIIIVRHIRPDGDCVGSSLGLRDIIKTTYPEKKVYVFANDFADYLNAFGKEDEAKDEEFYKDALVIAVDTSNSKRISNDYYDKGKFLIKIDHHIETEPYGDINWVEEEKSSVSEMIADFYNTFKDELKITMEGATLVFLGIVTDTGRFKFSSVDKDTLVNAGEMLSKGVDLESMYAKLYLKDFEIYKLQSEVFKKMKITQNGVAYIYIDKKMQKKFNLTPESASQMVGALDSIKGSLIWIAFIDNSDKTIRVRLRSRFMSINQIAEKYNGGGHAKASGAVVYNKKEMKALISDADNELKVYKENNDGWL